MIKQKIKWDSPIKKFTKAELYSLGDEIFYFCRNVLKLKPRRGVYPILWIRPKKKSNSYGEYCPFLHTVEIFTSECDSVRRFVDTVIHEYVHSCQPWIGVRYTVHSKKFGYQKNPFEVEARTTAKERRTKCISHLKKMFND